MEQSYEIVIHGSLMRWSCMEESYEIVMHENLMR